MFKQVAKIMFINGDLNCEYIVVKLEYITNTNNVYSINRDIGIMCI